MKHSVPPEILYSTYWYRSGTNATMREHLKGIAEAAMTMIGAGARTVLDIGCNDGTLLHCYPSGYTRLGIDPSDVAGELRDGVTVISDLFPSAKLAHHLVGSKVDIVTSIAMFYDLEDPVGFACSIRDILAADGLWILEMSYMPRMLERDSYDTICHEHLEYYSFGVVEKIMSLAGLKVVRISMNDINGGSLRCYAAHRDCPIYQRQAWADELHQVRQAEFELELDTDLPYRRFQERISVHRKVLSDLLTALKRDGKRIHVYGASTKGNTILQWCGIDHRLIDVAAERNPDKYGAYTIGTGIPIISEAESRAMNPDYYLVLPWHFRDEFLKREKPMLEAGVGMIFPLPAVEVVRQ
jgi:SAM-dependent methyltransferase